HNPGGGQFVVTILPRAYVWVDAHGAGASHTTSGGAFVTTNDLNVSAAAVINSRIVVAAWEGTSGVAPTSADLGIAT
ncbi:hypothetical protein, partial [Salmonella enterica]|uniref:hypothetical protein n=1 Tax=Salmonella enterica TaxID=28901 RepID=UPI003EDBC384